jgi:hypothetical protein
VSPLAKSLVVFACICGGALLGMFLRHALPGQHLNSDTKDVVRLGTGLVGTIAALVLGLLIASAKTSFDTQSTQIKQLTANIILLDGFLAQYGSETAPARAQMRRGIGTMIERIWRENTSDLQKQAPFAASRESEEFIGLLQRLSPRDDAQRSLQDRVIQAGTEIFKTRLLLFVHDVEPIPIPFLIVLVFWLTIIFASFSLFAQPNAVVFSALLVFALSAAGAVFLILELGQPFAGLMQISDEPLRNALVPLSP